MWGFKTVVGSRFSVVSPTACYKAIYLLLTYLMLIF